MDGMSKKKRLFGGGGDRYWVPRLPVWSSRPRMPCGPNATYRVPTPNKPGTPSPVRPADGAIWETQGERQRMMQKKPANERTVAVQRTRRFLHPPTSGHASLS